MSFRVTPEFKAKLDKAAKESGRSLAQEIEFRLERSLDKERYQLDSLELAFGPQIAGVMLALGHIMRFAGMFAAAKRRTKGVSLQELWSGWLWDTEQFPIILEAINLFLELIGPNENQPTWENLQPYLSSDASSEASSTLSSVGVSIIAAEITGRADGETFATVPVIRSWLGARLVARLKFRLALRFPKEG
jgi:hypothetical protein